MREREIKSPKRGLEESESRGVNGTEFIMELEEHQISHTGEHNDRQCKQENEENELREYPREALHKRA